jgi:hypothetical protein
MSLKRAVDVKWAVVIILLFVAGWVGVYFGCGGRGKKLPPMNRVETRVGVMCTNPQCQATGVMTLQEYDQLERNPEGGIKCPTCGQFTYALNRHYRPEPAPTPETP